MERKLMMPTVRPVSASFPLRLSEVNWVPSDKSVMTHDVKAVIDGVITDYFFFNCHGDSSEENFTIKDTYVNTVQITKDSLTVFMILLKHYPGGMVNSRLLFYNHRQKRMLGREVDFNLYARYQLDNGVLKETFLKKKLNIDFPEIEIIDTLGKPALRLNRLYRNGTSNAMESTIIHVYPDGIDTLGFTRHWLQ